MRVLNTEDKGSELPCPSLEAPNHPSPALVWTFAADVAPRMLRGGQARRTTRGKRRSMVWIGVDQCVWVPFLDGLR